ncbi:unnamed protein product [Timema podura]|uniref:Uncharacterized protein n=1 Tax=Timema podura TaxID=61482 RepID=A0ABN7NYH6_TIMPD|nr:unnamed protein product [Timema podura]
MFVLALHRCAREDNLQACRILLSYNVDTTIISLQGYTAVQVATEICTQNTARPSLGQCRCCNVSSWRQPRPGTLIRFRGCSPPTHKLLTAETWMEGTQPRCILQPATTECVVVEFLLAHGADVHAKDKGGLVPLHNACSYGHYEVTELLVKHGASVNVADLWKFTPLHEAAAKGKAEYCSITTQGDDC